jgi:hypothetical protein
MLFLASGPSKMAGLVDALDGLDGVDVATNVATDCPTGRSRRANGAPSMYHLYVGL